VSKWVYQSYTQYGFNYVSNPDASQSLLPIKVDINYYHSRLGKYLGDGGRFMEFSAYPQARYEDLLNKGSRMVFFHGTIDPFVANSLTGLSNPAAELLSFITEGGFHCQGMGTAVSDPSDLAWPSQRFMMKKLQEWVSAL
jgi:hypothetical protein